MSLFDITNFTGINSTSSRSFTNVPESLEVEFELEEKKNNDFKKEDFLSQYLDLENTLNDENLKEEFIKLVKLEDRDNIWSFYQDFVKVIKSDKTEIEGQLKNIYEQYIVEDSEKEIFIEEVKLKKDFFGKFGFNIRKL
jgi:hypothetical protein